jgi:predicted ArsR family transcriptional regulator
MSPAERRASDEVRVHRALSSQVRTRLLEHLRREPDLDAAALADRLELHVNTVRTHLAVLEEAGLVRTTVERRDRPGRPKVLYRATEVASGPVPLADDRGYRFLAGILASYLDATSKDTEAAAERAGAAWGRFVVDRPPPFTELAAEDGIERLVGMLRQFGFDPALEEDGPDGTRVLLRRCPFLDVAREHQEVVCSVHLGLMRGALDELGVEVEAADLLPWASPEGCISHLRVAARTAPPATPSSQTTTSSPPAPGARP